MLRIATLLVLVVLAVPTALAAPLTSVGVGPYGLTDGSEPYYLLVSADAPEAPHPASANDDCAAAARPADAREAAQGLIEPFQGWGPRNVSVHEWFPECVAVPIDACAYSACTAEQSGHGAWGYVAYDVATGRYYVEAGSSLVPVGGLPGQVAYTALAGSTGLGLAADCEDCPPPTCC